MSYKVWIIICILIIGPPKQQLCYKYCLIVVWFVAWIDFAIHAQVTASILFLIKRKNQDRRAFCGQTGDSRFYSERSHHGDVSAKATIRIVFSSYVAIFFYFFSETRERETFLCRTFFFFQNLDGGNHTARDGGRARAPKLFHTFFHVNNSNNKTPHITSCTVDRISSRNNTRYHFLLVRLLIPQLSK